MPNFFAALQAVDQPLEPVFCGGSDRSLQEREQWSSACNFIAVRPGVVVTYARNEATLRELEHTGFKTVEIGRASCRERVEIAEVAGAVRKRSVGCDTQWCEIM